MTFWLGVFIFAVGIMVSVCLHEAGHMVTAKRFGMKVTHYFAGFGPTLWSFRRGETEYGVKAIPAGGFVKIVGMTPLEADIDAEDEPRAFWRQATWKRTIVLVAGSTTHFLLAIVIFFLAALTTGLPNAAAASFDPQQADPVIGQVARCIIPGYDVNAKDELRACRVGDPAAPARLAGLKAGDRVVSVAGKPITTYGEFVTIIRARPAAPTQLTYLRDGATRTTSATLVATRRPGIGAKNAKRLETVSAIGVSVKTPKSINHYSALAAPGAAVGFTGTTVKQTFSAIGQFPNKIPNLIDAIGGKQRDPNGPVSVVGASRIGGEAAQLGLPIIFLALLGGLNVFIGVFNLFPLLPLDGGHVAVIWFERARSWLAARRGLPDPGRVDYNKLMPVTYVVILLFGGLTVLTLAADIVNPIRLG